MAAEQEEDAWGPSEDAPLLPEAHAAWSSRHGTATLGATGSSTSSTRRPSSTAHHTSTHEEVLRLRPLLHLRISPTSTGGDSASGDRGHKSSGGSPGRSAGPPLVLPLQSLALGVVAKHVSELAAAVGPSGCSWLPSEVKASLLAAARRRGELTDDALLSFSDQGLVTLDLSGSRVCGAELLRAAARMPNLRALDVSRCERVSGGCLRKLARTCPRLALLRLGGSAACNDAAAAALQHIVPVISSKAVALELDGADELAGAAVGGPLSQRTEAETGPLLAAAARGIPTANGEAAAAAFGVAPAAETLEAAAAAAAADSWEDLASSEEESERGAGGAGDSRAAASAAPPLPGGSNGGARMWELRVVVWPDCPREVRMALQRLCPKVVLNPSQPAPGALAGALPREVDPSVPLDEMAFAAVGPAALEDLLDANRKGRDSSSVPSVAERFRQAYIDRDARRRAAQERHAWMEQRRALRDAMTRSGGARELSSWLDAV